MGGILITREEYGAKIYAILKRRVLKKTRQLHQPGIEPGSVPWQGTILPLDH